MVVSVARRGMGLELSGEDVTSEARFQILDDEIGKSLDFRFYKRKDFLVKNNNVVITIENQYGENLPFFGAPIGGVPVYKPRITVKKVTK